MEKDRKVVSLMLRQYFPELNIIYCGLVEVYDCAVQAGYTPLHTACHFGQISVVEYLLRQGASTEAVTKVDPFTHPLGGSVV